MIGDAINARLGARLVFVTLIPNLYFLVIIGSLLLAGAPGVRPSREVLQQRLSGLSPVEIGLALVAVVAASLATHPLLLPVIQVIEGYWLGLPFGPVVDAIGRRRHEQIFRESRDAVADDSLSARAQALADRRLRWMPDQEDLILPTELGNVLFAGEVRAGARYGLRTDIAWPRLRALVPEPLLEQVNDTRNQVDACARFCVMSILAAVVAFAVLLPYDGWLVIPLGLYLVAWGSYRGAVAAAKRFCEELEVAFDLHHLTLWTALALPRPADIGDEIARGEVVSNVLAETHPPGEAELAVFTYVSESSESPAVAGPR